MQVDRVQLGINGFGRIGRLVLRAALEDERQKVRVVAINDPFMNIEYMVYQLKYDSVHGKLNNKVSYDNEYLIIDDTIRIRIFNEKQPQNIKWGQYQVDYVCESSGVFLTQELANSHIQGGAKKVILSAPPKDDTQMYVMGVNHKQYNKQQMIISNASCTTNCLAPLAKLIHDKYGIEEGLMTTIHATTANQLTVDGPCKGGKDWRAGRSIINNLIPSTTGAAKAVGKVIPELNNKLTGMAIRVPTNNVSIVDLTLKLQTNVNYNDICEYIKSICNDTNNDLSQVMGYTDQPNVSTDFIHDKRSCIFDIQAGVQLNPNFIKLIAWYDNEWGYSNRIIDLAIHMHSVDTQ